MIRGWQRFKISPSYLQLWTIPEATPSTKKASRSFPSSRVTTVRPFGPFSPQWLSTAWTPRFSLKKQSIWVTDRVRLARFSQICLVYVLFPSNGMLNSPLEEYLIHPYGPFRFGKGILHDKCMYLQTEFWENWTVAKPLTLARAISSSLTTTLSAMHPSNIITPPFPWKIRFF